MTTLRIKTIGASVCLGGALVAIVMMNAPRRADSSPLRPHADATTLRYRPGAAYPANTGNSSNNIGTPAAAYGIAGKFSVAKLGALELKIAASKGDRAPSLIQHVAGTREQANLWMSGDVVPGNQPVYLVAMRGHFHGLEGLETADHPQLAVVKWTTEVVVIDAVTGSIMDSGSTNFWPHLAAHGRVVTDRGK